MARTRGVTRRLLAGVLVLGGVGVASWAVAGSADDSVEVVVPDRGPVLAAEPATTIKVEPPARHPAAGVPDRVRVPSMGIDAPITGIDVRGGILTPPSDPQTLGWWQEGARPGALQGSALVTGHTLHAGGGALDDLEKARLGAPVEIRTRHGLIRYRVTKVDIYRKANLAREAQRVFSQTGPGRLVLITCEDWDGEKYLSNVVVYAEAVTPP